MTKFGISIAAFAAICMSASAQDGPLQSEMTAWLVTADEAGNEVLEQVEDVAPGALVEYKLAYTNVGEQPLTGLVVSVPVPEAMDLELGTENTEVASTFETTIDNGENWGVPPIDTANGEPADADDYDLVRWTTAEAIEPGETWDFAYRVVVE